MRRVNQVILKSKRKKITFGVCTLGCFSNKPNLPALADSDSVKIRKENYEIFRKNIR